MHNCIQQKDNRYESGNYVTFMCITLQEFKIEKINVSSLTLYTPHLLQILRAQITFPDLINYL